MQPLLPHGCFVLKRIGSAAGDKLLVETGLLPVPAGIFCDLYVVLGEGCKAAACGRSGGCAPGSSPWGGPSVVGMGWELRAGLLHPLLPEPLPAP